ncbi:MAG: hypothetical protein B7Z62_08830 [Deltaproteobacteria bacterium 37-65-8]|nr:MAG: hypothetical protein B7Z62_08830 [Deltaproteobacteria bacterium 37-65-8]
MAAIPEHQDPTLEAIDEALEATQDRSQRPYLGMSSIGRVCKRALWYGFRWASVPQFDAATLKRFEDGHRGEDLQAARLRLVRGIELHTVDTGTGQQFGFQDFGGHFRGHMDGAICGLIQAPKTFHVWEHKQTDDKKQAALIKAKQAHGEKQALCEWDLTYYAQGQLYMHYSGMERHYLTVATPGGRSTVSCRTEYVKEDAEEFVAKAKEVIFAAGPLERISDKPDWYACKWCDHRAICHEQRIPQVSCRTCAHSTACADGTWKCEAHAFTLTEQHQRGGCPDHLFIPSLITGAELVDADIAPVPMWVRYKFGDGEFINCSAHYKKETGEIAYTSVEMSRLTASVVADKTFQALLTTFNGTVVAAPAADFNDSLENV